MGSVSAANSISADENTCNIFSHNLNDSFIEISIYDSEGIYSFGESDEVLGLNCSDDILQDNVKSTFLSGNDIEFYYGNGAAYDVVLSDGEGKLLSNQNIIFNINGYNYTRTTNDDGIASITINLNSGNYNITSYYVGTKDYESSFTTNVVKVLSTINGVDIEKFYKNGTQYHATFLNSQGFLLNNADVVFNINGIFYERKTDEKGVARLNINLNPGEYILTAVNAENDEMRANTITVLPTINANDLIKYYKNNTQYNAAFVNGAGSPLVNIGVTFNINGVFYTRTTDDKGIAVLNINLNPGNYIITAINPINEEMSANNIEVLPTIFTEDLDMIYRNNQFIAHVIDGQGNPLANSDVAFNINGVFYTRITDNEGNAYLNINLDVGEYIITSTNNDLSISNKINIRKCNSFINASDVHINTGSDIDYRVILSGLNNKPIPFATIKFKYSDKIITAVSDKNGEAKIFISNPPEGKYSIEYEFEGDVNYHPYKSSNTIIVSDSTTILIGNDLKMIYKDGSKFKVTLTDSKFSPMANETITFNVAGISYNRITDKNGVAALDINLFPGTYEISYSYSQIGAADYYKGFNTIKISKIPVYLNTEDLVFLYGDNGEFTVKLTDNNKNPLSDIDVTLNINGNSYIRTTDENGVAKLYINLPVGYYEITTSLDNLFYTANTRSNHILVDGAIFVAYDITVAPNLYRDYSLTLLDAYNNPILNANVEFILNGVSKHAKTDGEGIATISVGGLSNGDYPIVYKFAERNTVGQSYIFVSDNVLYTKNTISDLEPYLAESKNCDVSNPEIVALARQLTERLSSPFDKAKAIYNYVRDEIGYGYYFDTKYGALGALHTKIGNCVDQSHLSIALYRAAGLPARYVHGQCTFNDGDRYGHVWVQVLVGDNWIVSDSINTRNSFGKVVNWNNYNYKLYGYFPYILF